MAESVSTVTRKGQVTVPIEIRRALGINEGDQVTFVLDNGEARLRRQTSYVERTAGIVKSDRPASTAEQLRQAAEEAIAADASSRMSE